MATVLAALVVGVIGAITPLGATAAAAPAPLTGARWIWYPEGVPQNGAPVATRWFRTTLNVPVGGVSDAWFTVTGDDTVDVWLNGSPLAASNRVVDSWKTALTVDLRPALVTGANTLAVAVRNAGGPAGLVGRARVTVGSTVVDVSTGPNWTVANAVAEGWEKPGAPSTGWVAAADLGAYGMDPWRSDVTVPDPAATASPLNVASGSVDNRVNPLGVDPAEPRFGWKLAAATGQQRQSAYQLTVTNAAGGTVWDSGRVASSLQNGVAYRGPALASLTAYNWRVRVWDGLGRASAQSAANRFETALRTPATEWTADFVGRGGTAPDLAGANWIWTAADGDAAAGVPVGTRYFRRTVTLASAPASARLVVTGDDAADVWINGVQVSTTQRVTDSWKRATVVDLAGRLTAGANSIAVRGENTTQGPAGVIAKLVVPGTTVVTDTAWRSIANAPAGWEQRGFNDAAWPAARIGAGYGAGPWASNVTVTAPAPLLRKEFDVTKPVASARLLTTALGLHETRLNGGRVGAEVLAPGWTDYTRRVQYAVSDVTGQLRQGRNAIGAWLGNGWYSGSLGFAGAQRYGTQPWYSAQLAITFTDGTSTVVRTDNSWRTTDSPISADDLYHGESYDARRFPAGWDNPGFADGGWPTAGVRAGAKPNLVSRVDNGAQVQQDLRPVAITQPAPGVWVFDLGQNFAGWNRLAVSGPVGTTVTMRHAEVLQPDGRIYTTNLRAAQATDRFTLAGTGGTEVYEPRFTMHGYRYVEVTGLPAPPTVDTITGRAAWTAGGQPGTFSSSSALLNQLQHNIVWGERSNMVTIPTDCPQRDERLGWTGDIAIFAATSTFNLDMSGFLGKYADDLVDAQHADGSFTDVVPDVLGGSGSAGWGDAGVIVPYTLWQRYGDTEVITAHFDAMVRWVEYLRSTANLDLIRDRPTFGDWLNVNDNTAQDVVSTAYFGWSARLVSRMAAAIGRTGDAATYGSLADRVATAFTNRFVGADGTVANGSQTAYVLALSFGLLPANRVRPAADRLAAKVAASGGHLSVGFLGVENLLPVLADNGHPDVAYQVLTQPGFPGWGYMINRGATTIWERWDGIRPDGSFNDPGMNSFNHYGLGSVGDFLYRQVGGLSAAAPGYASLLVAPRTGGGLSTARSAYETPYGAASSDWSVSGGTVTLRVTVPPGSSATVRVPTSQPGSVTAPAVAVPSAPGVYQVLSGSHVFTAPV